MSSTEQATKLNGNSGELRPDTGKADMSDEGIVMQGPIKVMLSKGNSVVNSEGEGAKSKDAVALSSSATSSGVGSPGSTKRSTSSSSYTRSNVSCGSQESFAADTVSLPAERSMSTGLVTGRTVSDPSIRLSAVLSGTDETGNTSEVVTQLLQQVVTLKMEVARLQEENKKLQKVQNKVDDEIHQLTENLFEEAYKMVDEAKGERASAEKRLADATGKIDAMETRMSALNNLIHTKPGSSSSSPLLHPPTHKHHRRPSVKKLMKKLTKVRHPKSKLVPVVEHSSVMKGAHQLQGGEMSSEDITEFHSWSEAGFPTMPPETHPYFDELYRLDIIPCLTFRNSELSQQVLHAVQNNTIMLESLAVSSNENPTDERPCSLTGDTSNPCSYRLKVQGSDQWHFISANSRNRIVTVCDFYSFIGYIQKGIIKKDEMELFWQVSRHRALIHIAKLNLSLVEQSVSSPSLR